MLKNIVILIFTLLSYMSFSQTYLISAGGTVNTCSGTFYDNGGAAGNYSNNANYTMTFCNDAGGEFPVMIANFTSMVLSNSDFLLVYDGPDATYPLIGSFAGGSFGGYLESSGSCLTFNFISNTGGNSAGWVATLSCYICGDELCHSTFEDCSTCSNDCGVCLDPIGGPYYQQTSGLGGSYLGIEEVNTCTGTFYDDGGPGVQYSNNINSIYRTFCPDAAGNVIQATVNRLDIEAKLTLPLGCYDYIYVLDGPTQNSPVLWQGCGDDLGLLLTMAGAYGTGIFTATSASGCLTFRFSSDVTNTVYEEGWDIALACVAGVGPTGVEMNDCFNSYIVCVDDNFAGSSTGPGIVADAGTGCAQAENYSSWYYFEIQSSGNLIFTINPIDNNDDYDFALYNSTSCATLGNPVRCSYASNIGNTGLVDGSTDLAEDVSGDAWVEDIDVVAGEGYFLMINKWTAGGSGFDLIWGLSGGASLDCSATLPISLTEFKYDCNLTPILLWSTASEINNDYFEIEYTKDFKMFQTLGKIQGHGNSNSTNNYEFPISYNGAYRLKQVDYDGQYTYSEYVTVKCDNTSIVYHLYPNPINRGDALTISNLTDNDVVSIVDVLGRKVNENTLISGVYLVFVNDIFLDRLIVK
jgi:hypothetical protein